MGANGKAGAARHPLSLGHCNRCWNKRPVGSKPSWHSHGWGFMPKPIGPV